MKILLKSLSIILVLSFVSITAFNCTNSATSTDQNSVKANTNADAKVGVYYFHAVRRCATCQAVESVTKEAVKEYYGTKIPVTIINRETEKENPMIKKYEISGQTLLVIKGDEVVNLTTDAFMYARTNPDKLKALIKTTIDSML